MEIESLFSDVKWRLLKLLSEKPSSPLMLAKKLDTTISNVSQQLRLLSVAGLISKTKVSNRDKGRPRTLFSLSADYTYLISIMDTFTEKKLLALSDYHKLILKIWFLENPALHYYVEKFFWKVEERLGDIGLIAIDPGKPVNVILVSEKKRELKKNYKRLKIHGPDGEKTFICSVYNKDELRNNPSLVDGYFVFYDPDRILLSLRALEA